MQKEVNLGILGNQFRDKLHPPGVNNADILEPTTGKLPPSTEKRKTPT
jgi:hypothetical protein